MERRNAMRAVVVSVALVGAAVVGAATWRPTPKNFGVVDEGRVYRSGALTPDSLRTAKERYHIKTVVDLGGHHEGSKGDLAEAEAAKALGVKRFVLRLEGDGAGDPNKYVEALKILTDPANQPALVHCAAGAQRTGAATILYRAATKGTSITEAYPEAKEYGHKPGKDWRMLAYLADWSDEILRAYRDGTTIDANGAGSVGSAGAPATHAVSGAPSGAETRAPEPAAGAPR